MFTLTKAMPGDEALCMEIIADGRQFQQEQGFVQWTEDYPALPDIAGDIATGKGYLLREGDTVLGYLCLDFDGEPAYTGITEGSWRWEEPYGVVHRLALNRAGRGRGLSSRVFTLVEERCREQGIRCLRADTDPENARMQHILEKVGFEKRGIIIFQGSGKFAYEKRI